uniref:Snakin-2 n=1 Tax=Cajanus cajan TaxID=3821 RepID=A0A151U6E7_CAJCA|nr:Snakin-2 [Cajanus cajan]
MALNTKLLVATLLASLLLLHLVDADQSVSEPQAYAQTQGSLLQQIDCKGACGARCRLSSRPRLCQRACGTCCRRCNCVPPGTAGNQEVCPCYASLTTHGGKRKCP